MRSLFTEPTVAGLSPRSSALGPAAPSRRCRRPPAALAAGTSCWRGWPACPMPRSRPCSLASSPGSQGNERRRPSSGGHRRGVRDAAAPAGHQSLRGRRSDTVQRADGRPDRRAAPGADRAQGRGAGVAALRRRAASAVVRPAAAVVSRPARARHLGLHRGRAPALPRSPRRDRAHPRADRDRAPTRSAADHVREPGRSARAARRRSGAGRAADDRSRARGPGRAGARRGAGRAGRDPPPLQPRARSAHPPAAAAARPRAARPAGHAASHRRRWLVARHPDARAEHALRGLRQRPGLALARAADPVRGLRGVAARVADGPGAGKPAPLLARAAGRPAGAAAAARAITRAPARWPGRRRATTFCCPGSSPTVCVR